MKQESFPYAIFLFTGRCTELSDDFVTLVSPRKFIEKQNYSNKIQSESFNAWHLQKSHTYNHSNHF